MVAPRELGTHPLGHDQHFFASYATEHITFNLQAQVERDKLKGQRRRAFFDGLALKASTPS